jgi:hypothetical protein
MERRNYIVGRQGLCVTMSLVLGLMLLLSIDSLAAQNENISNYKMLSSLEYSGKNQFRNEIETLCTVTRQASSDDAVRYVLSTNDINKNKSKQNSEGQSSLKELSFVIDGKTQRLSTTDKDVAFLESVTNQCAKILKRVTTSNVGKTWKQSFDLSPLGGSLPQELRFTLTAMQVKTETLGEFIAVRALSEPFSVKITNEKGDAGLLQCKINSVYVFDRNFEDIHLSISVYRATTNINGLNETLQHSVATCKADAEGKAADLRDLGRNKDFEKFVSKLGLTSNLEVVQETPLPQWARLEGIKTAQVANICAGISCEGALNPVASVFMPAARTVELQGLSKPVTTSAQLASTGGEGSGGGNMFEWFGWNIPTAIFVTGVTFGTLGAAGAFNETEIEYRSPSQ